jgi:tRNA dimethylallyltransferase
MKKLLVICGPTATGKTALAAYLAKRFNGELISADSRQVYRGMDLVTGKDHPDVPIWLYDVVDPDDDFSVSQWVKLAIHAMNDIQGRKKIPIVVGGTGLYINALLKPFETLDIPPDKKLREKLYALPVSILQTMIERGNINDSDWNNPRRLVRRIEVYKSKKHPQQEAPKYDCLIIGVMASNPILDARIDKRIQERKENGMDKEIAKLRAQYDAQLPSMSAIGINEHAYARRQMTWFKKQEGIHWFDITDPDYQDNVTELITGWYT